MLNYILGTKPKPRKPRFSSNDLRRYLPVTRAVAEAIQKGGVKGVFNYPKEKNPIPVNQLQLLKKASQSRYKPYRLNTAVISRNI